MRGWSPEIIIVIIGGITALITAVAAGAVKIIGALQGVESRVQQVAGKIDATAQQVSVLEVKVDGRLSELLERTASASRLEGLEAGRGKMVVPMTVPEPHVVDANHLVVALPVPTPPILLIPVEDKKEREGG